MNQPRLVLSHRTVRLLTLALLGVVLAGFAAVVTGPVLAEPTPSPAPGSGAPDPGVRPSPNPTPPGGPSPNPAPSPIGPPPTNQPSPSPSQTPAPAPGPTPTGWSPPSNEEYGDPGLFDIPGQVRKAIDEFFAWAVESALNPVLSALGETVLSTPDLTDDERVRTLWTTSFVVANALLVLFMLAGAFLLASRETLQTRHGLKEILPRLAVAGVLINTNLVILDKGIEATNAVTAAIAGQGVNGKTAADAIAQALGEASSGNSFLLTLLILGVLVMAVAVVFTFVLRVACLAILVGIAPLALLCHASPLTEQLALTWWRAVGACLGIQIGQGIVLLATVRVFLVPAGDTVTGPGLLIGIPTPSRLISILVVAAMLWLLIKIPGWTRHMVLGPLGSSRGLLSQLLHMYVMVKTLGAAAGLARGATTAARAAGTAGGRPGTTPRPGGGRPSPTGGPRPRPRPGPSRPSPSPAGPAAFSHAPASHTPLSSRAGTNAAPVFSHAPSPSPSPAGSSPSVAVPGVQFSRPSPAEAPSPAPGTRAARVAFSDAASATPRRAGGGPGPGVTFSAAPAPQSAPRRPPALVTPVFSSAAGTQAGRPRGGASPASRPTAARRAAPVAGAAGTAGTRTPSAGIPWPTPPARRAAPSPPPSPTGRPPATPSPRSSPASGLSPVFRAARPAPSPPSPPSWRRPQDRGEQR
ncbi:hypothetical protein [Phytohabitans houttuyneae]|uniref:Uncharacterized protein n=1 Tax=Phytohabitans houttuyneae TaxID=1076126 RepID=A0A6V8KSM7_9ACTN|nr:hypothetical protein [Phytohabitans houttuyneae]GFJ84836.1 hypothetical protein Phou_090160 [Phytohabitans houttuyneae]